jgi:hypothetical protein
MSSFNAHGPTTRKEKNREYQRSERLIGKSIKDISTMAKG